VSNVLPYIVIGLTAGSVYGLAGTGLVLTYKTSGIFNFAHGTIAAVMAYAFYDLRQRQGLPWPLALAVCLLVLTPAASLLLERMARRLADAPVATKVVATVGLIVGIQQLIIIRYGGSIIQAKPFLPTRTLRIAGVNVGVDQLIVMVVALAGMVGLTLFLRTRSGRQMRALVDQPDLLAMHGTNPVKVRRRAWLIGTAFTTLSGIQLAPTVGLDAPVLTLLVVEAFGAAAIGMFTSIPLTYVGGLVVGVAAAMSTKYVATIPWLSGFPPSVPFIVLFAVLVIAPGRWLVDFAGDRRPIVRERRQLPARTRWIGGAAFAGLLLWLPYLVGTRLAVYTSALAYVLMFLSLTLLMRTSGQVSLAQLAFAAVGAAASARLSVDAGLPWFAAVLLGALIAVPVGAVLAIPAIRRSGLYLALATFGFAVLLERLVFFTTLMFGASTGSLRAPRPSFASGDRAYFYVALAVVAVAVAFVVALQRSRLGRLLRAMADSPTALTTSGTNVIVIKVIVFCVAAFLAGLGGALLGPVTGSASPANFDAFTSLELVVLAVLVGGTEVTSSIGAALALVVLPSYITSPQLNNYLPVVFGIGAVLICMSQAGVQVPGWLARASGGARRRRGRSPATARVELRARPEPA
jgi:branched-subunit amino acid ABC-type transport system permease component